MAQVNSGKTLLLSPFSRLSTSDPFLNVSIPLFVPISSFAVPQIDFPNRFLMEPMLVVPPTHPFFNPSFPSTSALRRHLTYCIFILFFILAMFAIIPLGR